MIFEVQYPSWLAVTGRVTYFDPDSIRRPTTFKQNIYRTNIHHHGQNKSNKDILARISSLENNHRSLVLTAKLAAGVILTLGLGYGVYQNWGQISSAAHALACKLPWISQAFTCVSAAASTANDILAAGT